MNKTRKNRKKTHIMKTSKGNEYHKEKSGKIDKIIIDNKVGCITVNNSFEVLKRDTQTVQDNYEHSQKALESLKIDYENLQKELNDIKEKNKNDKKHYPFEVNDIFAHKKLLHRQVLND